MNTQTRLTRLEDAIGLGQQCEHIIVWYDDGNPPPTEPPQCEECGVPFGTQIVVEYVDYARK